MRNLLGYASAAGLGLAVMLGPSLVHKAAEHEVQAQQSEDCVALVWDDVVAQYGPTDADAVWTKYLHNGWAGYIGDDMEALWSPNCTDEYLRSLFTS